MPSDRHFFSHNMNLDLIAKRMGFMHTNASLGLPFMKPNDGSIPDPQISGLNQQSVRLMNGGGHLQQDRMIYDKRRSLDRALLYSYQGANILKVPTLSETLEEYRNRVAPDPDLPRPPVTHIDIHPVRALINPDKLKQDYDRKIVSVPYEWEFKSGDVFEWLGTNTYWLIYLQDLTELAYFRGEIQRCSYEISWEEDGQVQTTYAAVRGPVETKIDYIQKHGISVDNPNYSLNILLPRTKESLEYFRRYSKFYLQGLDEGSEMTCWRVEATDSISTPGILEIIAVEYYANETEDDLELGLVGINKTKVENPNTNKIEATIIGDTFIKPKKSYTYKASVVGDGYWQVCGACPVRLHIHEDDPKQVDVSWTQSYSGQFELTYGNITKTIVVESLF